MAATATVKMTNINAGLTAQMESEKGVIFGGEEFSLFWSAHARLRTDSRGSSSVALADVFVRLAISRAEAVISDKLAEIQNTCDIYDRVADIFAVLSINRQKKKIYIVSYGDASKIYPRYGDTVIQSNEYGQIRIIEWAALRAEPVDTSVFCEMNGQQFRFRWTKWSAKNDKTKDKGEKKLCKIGEKLSGMGMMLPENEIINIWDWRTGTFTSVMIQPETSTIDVVLFRNVDFIPQKDIYSRINITIDDCEFIPKP